MRHCWRELHFEEERIKLLKSESLEDFVRDVLNLRSDAVLLWKWWDVGNKVNAGELMPTC